jgi:hypothetical protein
MKRILLTVTALLGLTTPASAATLTIEADHAAYHVGDTITLSINGDAQGATAFSVYGRLLFNGALVNNGTQTQQPLGPGWTLGNLGEGDSDLNSADSAYAEALNQISLDGSTQSAANPISTVTLVAQAPGNVEVIWDVVDEGFTLDFFGLTSAPGASFVIADVTTTTTLPTTTSSSSTSTTTTLPGNDIECGDVDGSGSIVASDALLLLKKAIGAEVPSLQCPGTCPTTTSSGP